MTGDLPHFPHWRRLSSRSGGHLSEQELDAFIATGFTAEQILEVIAIVAASTITNYAGSIANPPLEDQFQQFTWRG
jgi:alkylhydroperoxidase family enzyme